MLASERLLEIEERFRPEIEISVKNGRFCLSLISIASITHFKILEIMLFNIFGLIGLVMYSNAPIFIALR